ncbi:MAG: hypothetical protein ACR2F8_00280 [Caulobacteraceae bacterium]
MAAKLKVYVSNLDGVHQWIVAAANQGEALKAWGVSQNLFAHGAAKITDEAAAVKAALAAPGRPLRRLAGSRGPFAEAEASGDLAGWRAAAKAAGVTAAKVKSSVRPARDRAALDAAQAALADFETEAAARRADVDERRRSLENETRALEKTLAAERRRLETALEKARRAFEA